MRAARTIAAVIMSLGLVVVGCGDDEQVDAGDVTSTTAGGAVGTVPDGPPDITGEITSVTPFVPITEDCTPPEDLDPNGSVSSDDPPICTPEDNDVVGTVLVEAEPGVQSGDKISLTVTTSTVLTGTGTAAFADLAEGQQVEAWSTGVCAESYPLQCTAVAIHRI
jgi:hypothetical protein